MLGTYMTQLWRALAWTFLKGLGAPVTREKDIVRCHGDEEPEVASPIFSRQVAGLFLFFRFLLWAKEISRNSRPTVMERWNFFETMLII